MGLLTREDILAAQDIKYESVDVPEWGGTVRIKTLSGVERAVFDDFSYENRQAKGQLSNAMVLLCTLSVVGEDGKPLFAEKDIAVLKEKSSAPIQRIWSAALKLNRMRKEDLEGTEGNSEDGQTS